MRVEIIEAPTVLTNYFELKANDYHLVFEAVGLDKLGQVG